MLTGIVAGRAAGALWGQVFVVPRMLTAGSGSHLAFDLSAGRSAVCGLVAALAMLLSFGRRPKPTMGQASAALGISVLGFTGYWLLLVFAIRDAGSAMPSLLIGTIPL